jgi:hypothetical protein
MAITIGFATQFYTLWDVTEEKLYSTIRTANGEVHSPCGTKYICRYIKNIAKDLDKVMKLYPDLSIDESLRGKSDSFEYLKGDIPSITYAPELFSRGYAKGQVIADCEDLRVLKWGFDNENSSERISIIEDTILNKFGLVYVNGGWLVKEKAEQILNEKELRDNFYTRAEQSEQTIKFVAEKNLDSDGSLVVDAGGFKIRLYFADFKTMNYNGFEYGLPTIKGVGKKIKGKELEVKVKYQDHEIYGNIEKVLVVNSFNIKS